MKKSQQHFLAIQRRILERKLEMERLPYSERILSSGKLDRLMRTLHAVARDSMRARSEAVVAKSVRSTSYSIGPTLFGIPHVRSIMRRMITEYMPPDAPFIGIGCGDARLEADIMAESQRPLYLVDPDPRQFSGRPPFLPVQYKDARELPSSVLQGGGVILSIIWPEPNNGPGPAYDERALRTVRFDMLITIYSEQGEISGSPGYAARITELCTSGTHVILHNEHRDDGRVRFLILLSQQRKRAHDRELQQVRRAELHELLRRFPTIGEWRETVKIRIAMTKNEERARYVDDVSSAVRRFCKKEGLQDSPVCERIIDYILYGRVLL